MAKKEDIKKDVKEKNNVQENIKKSPLKWAREDKIDEMLFLYWKDELMTYEKYEKIKNKVYRRK